MINSPTDFWDEQRGYAITSPIVAPNDLPRLIEEAERLFALALSRSAGVRGVLRQSHIYRQFATSDAVVSVVTPILGSRAFVARAILFDKSADANWDVSWHQDATIAVAARVDIAGFGPWSMKDGIPHVRPPAPVLAGMLTVRIHLDPCDSENGPLLIAPGTHLSGIATHSPEIALLERDKATCLADAGAAVLMRPLLFHASRKATRPTHRRVLHLEFGASELPVPLAWADP